MFLSFRASLALLLLLPALGAAAVTPVHVYTDPLDAAPQTVTPPAQPANAANLPMVCVFAASETSAGYPPPMPVLFIETGGFTAYRYLSVQNANPLGCGVLVSIRQTGHTAWGVSYVDIYTPHGGALLEEIRAKGKWGPWLGYQSVALYLNDSLAPGRPLRRKLDASGKASLIGTDWVRTTAGANLLDFDKLLQGLGKNDNSRRSQLTALRDRELAAPRVSVVSLPAEQFEDVVRNYRASNPRPAVPEAVRRYQVMAEDAIRNKRFTDAVADYSAGLKVAPWWPQGHFNAAVVLGELHYYGEAIDQMQKYLALVPDAPNARAAQDQVYRWQSEEQAAGSTQP